MQQQDHHGISAAVAQEAFQRLTPLHQFPGGIEYQQASGNGTGGREDTPGEAAVDPGCQLHAVQPEGQKPYRHQNKSQRNAAFFDAIGPPETVAGIEEDHGIQGDIHIQRQLIALTDQIAAGAERQHRQRQNGLLFGKPFFLRQQQAAEQKSAEEHTRQKPDGSQHGDIAATQRPTGAVMPHRTGAPEDPEQFRGETAVMKKIPHRADQRRAQIRDQQPRRGFFNAAPAQLRLGGIACCHEKQGHMEGKNHQPPGMQVDLGNVSCHHQQNCDTLRCIQPAHSLCHYFTPMEYICRRSHGCGDRHRTDCYTAGSDILAGSAAPLRKLRKAV